MLRRDLFRTAALAGAATALPTLVRAQSGGGGNGGLTLPDAQSHTVGDMTVLPILDGTIRITPDQLSGVDQATYDELMRAAFRDPETYPSAINTFVIRSGDETMIVDAGTGGAMGTGAGQMAATLEAIGIAPQDITRLITTHLHPDHIGGAVSDGEATFPNAELVVSEAERAFWTDDANFSGAGEQTQMFRQMAQDTLDAYGDRLSVFEGETEVASGITSMPLPGHTPGHTGYMLSSGDQSLLIWADIVHVAPIQLARPDVTIGFDVDPDQAAQTRRQILDRVTSDRLLVAGSHMGFPGMANIASDGDGYRAVDALYGYDS